MTEEKKKKGNFPNLRFPGFEGEWEVKKLGDIADKVNSGKTPLGGEAVYTKEGVLFIRSQNVNNDKLELDNSVFISEEINRQMKNSIVQSNDILLNITGASLGRSCVVPDNFERGNVNQHVCIVRLKKQYNPRFVQPLFSSNKGQIIFTNLRTGSGREGLTFESIKSIKISIPFCDEQQKIASFLSLIDKRITTQSKIIEKYESLIKGIVDFHFKSCKHKTYSIKELGEYFNVMNLSKENLSATGNECILYGELFTTYGCVVDEIKSRTTKKDCKLTLSSNVDLLFPSSTTVNAHSLISPSAILKEGVILGGDMFGIHINENFNNEYLSYLFNYIYKSELSKYAKGSTIIHLHYNEIRNAKIEVPSLEEQKKVVKILRLLQKKLTIESTLLHTYLKQKNILLQQLFI
ncbi:restriction endonuclease subunit S [Bacteroides sp. 519]|uniref:restriction endonuclease subunit S n=1 Tax=Bacteroides sp. 519 TaxID=2302937 RepID=UPI0013D1B6DA|nr:restriction endonuclease subunit S [Bacteroides sp. 519]